MESIRNLAAKGLKKQTIIDALPISKTTFYHCFQTAEQYDGADNETIAALPDVDQKRIKFVESYEKGHREFIAYCLSKFQEEGDINILWKLFSRVRPEYNDKNIDIDELDALLTRKFGREKARRVVSILLDDEEEIY